MVKLVILRDYTEKECVEKRYPHSKAEISPKILLDNFETVRDRM